MKHTAGYAKPRRITTPLRRTRLNLQRRPKPDPEDELEQRQKSTFWKWVLLVALLHVLVILGVCFYFLIVPAPKPPAQFISLLPPGEMVKGTPGAQQAHKVGANTPAAPAHHAAPPPPPAAVVPPTPQPVAPPAVVKPPPPTPIIKETAPPIAPVKPVIPKPAKPKPKVKVDLHEVERTDTAETPKPAKHHAKKPVKNPDDSPDDTESSPDNTGLSKEQIAEKLGDKLNASGSRNATKSGKEGSPNGTENRFQDFYNLIAQQVHDEWNSPMTPVDVEPVVHIHVERDGRVPAEDVYLISSSGDPSYDDAAVQTVKRLGYLHEPLPDGCPPDIKINFNPNPYK
jgi:outer membrane biosynthesis protein TonB